MSTPLTIISHPDPRLYIPCEPVTEGEFGPALVNILDEMLRLVPQPTKHHAEGGIGLAGPQVGFMRRVLVMHVPGQPQYRIVNPAVRPLPTSRTEESKESCLSMHDLTVKVQRHNAIQVVYQDPSNGAFESRVFEGLSAFVVQHEVDHLNGVTLLAHARRGAKFDFTRKYGEPGRVL